MPRLHQAEFGLDTGMFSVHQMHPEVALRLAGSVGLGGLARQGPSLQSMITEHGLGLVIMSAEVVYHRELTFFSAPFIASDAMVRLREDGRLLIFSMRHLLDGEEAITMQVTARPIKLSGGPALDAVPSSVNSAIRESFLADERIPTAEKPTRSLGDVLRRWSENSELLSTGKQPVFICRSDCELADQWLYARLPSLVAEARERLMFEGASELAVCAGNPLQSFRAEYFRPMYVGDEGEIEVATYRRGEQTMVVHRVFGAVVPGATERPLCALAVELF
jgi:acyl-CoA thioesterase FadM